MELFENSKEAKNTAICGCGNKAKRVYGCQVIIDDWSPTGTNANQAQRDIEHFEKKKSRGHGQAIYQEDRNKAIAYNKDRQDRLDGKIQ